MAIHQAILLSSRIEVAVSATVAMALDSRRKPHFSERHLGADRRRRPLSR
jgi:hypothetical protein